MLASELMKPDEMYDFSAPEIALNIFEKGRLVKILNTGILRHSEGFFFIV